MTTWFTNHNWFTNYAYYNSATYSNQYAAQLEYKQKMMEQMYYTSYVTPPAPKKPVPGVDCLF